MKKFCIILNYVTILKILNHISIMLSFPKNIDSFLLRSSLGPYIKRDNPTAFAMGFALFIRSRIFGIF